MVSGWRVAEPVGQPDLGTSYADADFAFSDPELVPGFAAKVVLYEALRYMLML